ncbi:CD99 antigen-like protein 2 isoform X1 [Xyrauchen texanus]|uniref:CD99 antigen-like protein 2 isoform X1 n=1 Tax=Xyrauchen texanus TaxID=154827 RepID=UPI002241FF0C|nr:CD99 antigen-like protein 2 isoform X1 [Xyrauchen texanus]
MGKLSTWMLLVVFSLLVVKGISEDLADELNTATTAPKVEPVGGAGTSSGVKPTIKPPVQPTVKNTVKPKPKQTEETFTDFIEPTVGPVLLPRTTAKPLRASVPPWKVQSDPEGFNIEDALDPNNDIRGKDKDPGKSGGEFTDDDLLNVGNDNTYKPDKGKGGQATGGSELDNSDDKNYDTMAETGTIAGIVSAVAMALVGAVTSYISYQKKKFCFSIQQSLNTDMVKADGPDAVVVQEPQVQQTLLQPPNTEPPTEENAV